MPGREDVASPTTGTTGTASQTEIEKSVAQPRSLECLGLKEAAGVYRQEPEAETHLREWHEHSTTVILAAKFAPSYAYRRGHVAVLRAS